MPQIKQPKPAHLLVAERIQMCTRVQCQTLGTDQDVVECPLAGLEMRCNIVRVGGQHEQQQQRREDGPGGEGWQ
jgi:hypothetical protein